jgi:hypothetical protein
MIAESDADSTRMQRASFPPYQFGNPKPAPRFYSTRRLSYRRGGISFLTSMVNAGIPSALSITKIHAG